MKRSSRLESANCWLEKEKGQPGNVVKRYKRRYGVDWMCAFNELRMLGGNINEEYEKAVLQSIRNNPRKKKRTAENVSEIDYQDQDENFSFIAGYTPGGAPFGITWEEQEEIDKQEKRNTER